MALSLVSTTENCLAHLNRMSKYGVSYIVAINSYTDRNGRSHTVVPYSRHRSDINDLVSHVTQQTNYFLPLNAFTKVGGNYRTDMKHLKYLRAIWLDIDLKAWVPEITESAAKDAKVKRDFYYNVLPVIMSNAGLMKPTEVDDSGYGFHILYVFDKQIALNKHHRKPLLASWEKTMHAMVTKFNQASHDLLGVKLADTSAESPVKLLRLVGSVNCKYGREVPCKTVKFTNLYYSMWELYREYARKQTKSEYKVFHKQAVKARKQYRKIGKKWEKEDKLNAKNKAVRAKKRILLKNIPVLFTTAHKSRYTLYKARMEDIIHLIHIRKGQMFKYIHKNGSVAKQECAEFAIFLFAVNYVHLKHDKHLIMEQKPYDLGKTLRNINNLIAPEWRLDSEKLDKIFKEAHQYYFMDYGYLGAKRYLNRDWYIEALGLTNAEMEAMKTLITPAIKQQRRAGTNGYRVRKQRIKRQYLSKLVGAKHTREKRRESVMRLHDRGLSYRQIRRQIHISVGAISKILRND